jgi:hypothetical protein
VATDAQGELERVLAQASAVNSDLRRYQTYADVQSALGRLYATLGIDPIPDDLDVADISGASNTIRRLGSDWQGTKLLAALPNVPAPSAPCLSPRHRATRHRATRQRARPSRRASWHPREGSGWPRKRARPRRRPTASR